MNEQAINLLRTRDAEARSSAWGLLVALAGVVVAGVAWWVI